MVDSLFKSDNEEPRFKREWTAEEAQRADVWDALVESCEKDDNERGIVWEAPIGTIMIGAAEDE